MFDFNVSSWSVRFFIFKGPASPKLPPLCVLLVVTDVSGSRLNVEIKRHPTQNDSFIKYNRSDRLFLENTDANKYKVEQTTIISPPDV